MVFTVAHKIYESTNVVTVYNMSLCLYITLGSHKLHACIMYTGYSTTQSGSGIAGHKRL